MAGRKTPLIRSYREVGMHNRLLEHLAQDHRDALEADQKSPKTIRFYRQRQETALRDLERLAGHPPTLADWLDPELQRRRGLASD